jgi:hypothetical protein
MCADTKSNLIATEKHYRVAELAKLWGIVPGTVIRYFRNEPGVLKLMGPSITGRKKRCVLSIPESVASRVHERLSHNSFETAAPSGNPLRIIRLRDLDARMPKKARHVADGNASH